MIPNMPARDTQHGETLVHAMQLRLTERQWDYLERLMRAREIGRGAAVRHVLDQAIAVDVGSADQARFAAQLLAEQHPGWQDKT